MASELRVIQNGNGWYIDTPVGQIGPMDSKLEAEQFLSLMNTASMARAEMGCTDAECFI